MKNPSEHNFSMLLRYQLFTGLAISMATSWAASDLLFLKMGLDLKQFGIIRGQMYLLPAITYFLAADLLRKWDHDVDVCVWGYLIRSTLPLTLPVGALLCRNANFLLYLTSAVMAICYTCAMFANNTLTKIMRDVLPAETLNRKSIFLFAVASIPVGVCIPVIHFLERYSNEPDKFLLYFAVIQGVLVCSDLPAILSLRKLRFPPIRKKQNSSLPKLPWKKLFTRDTVFLLVFKMLHGAWIGLSATYFVIYLMKVRFWNASWVLWLDLILSILMLFGGVWIGKLLDRFGYAPVLTVFSLFIALLSALWGFYQNALLLFLPFLLLIYNGNNGMFSGVILLGENTAAVRLVEPSGSERFLGLSSLLGSCVSFFACILAGHIYGMLSGTPEVRLRQYFTLNTIPPLLMLLCAFLWLIFSPHKKAAEKQKGSMS